MIEEFGGRVRVTVVDRIAIAQPTFLPWVGWFDLTDQVDLSVLLDDVAFSRQSWQQRNRIRTPDGLEFLTVPVRTSGRAGQRIADTEFVADRFVEKALRTIAQCYSRAPYYKTYYSLLRSVLEKHSVGGNLCDLNCALIEWMLREFRIDTPTIRASALRVGGKRGEHVALICEQCLANTYISPAGAEDYLMEDREEFLERRIDVELQAYEHPQYHQCFEPFLPYASALDLLFNVGEGALTIIRSGRRESRRLISTDRTRAGG